LVSGAKVCGAAANKHAAGVLPPAKQGASPPQKKPQSQTPISDKAVFVSRTKSPVFLPKALLRFTASIQEILFSYETAKHFKKKFFKYKRMQNHR